MQRIFLLTMCLLSLYSCGIHEIGGSDVKGGGSKWGGMGSANSGTSASPPVCYMTVLDYQKGYDWRTDSERGTVRCSLVVYADGRPIMKVPVGDAYETGSDVDMHRIIKGHLYTDYSTDSETVIKKDGTQLYRYPSRESILGMDLLGDDLYSLGQFRDGTGFALRKNGEVLLRRESATIIGQLHNDRDSLYFSFYEKIDGNNLRYYSYMGTRISQVAVREDIKHVWDVLARQDEIMYVASLVGVNAPVLFIGDQMRKLSLKSDATLISCRIFKTEEFVGVEGLCRLKTGEHYNVVWLDTDELYGDSNGGSVVALQTDGDGVFFAINPSVSDGVIYRAGEQYEMPTDYAVMGPDCMCVLDGILHVGLSSTHCANPLVWKDGAIDTLNINGYISAMYSDIGI